MNIKIKNAMELNLLRRINQLLGQYRIPEEIILHMEDILNKNDLGKGGYIILLLIDNDTNVKDIYDKILKDNHIQKDWCEFHDTICTHNGKIYYSDLFIIGSEYSVTIIWNELKEQN